jgi:hypothetical protein
MSDTAPQTRPSVPRMYDYVLGGSHNLPIDREAMEQVRRVMPDVEDVAWANRGFLQRASRWLAEEAGIRQFLDIGAGLPTVNNTHEVVQKVSPDARVVYVDNAPEFEAVAGPLVADVDGVAAVRGDLRDPEGVLNHPQVRNVIDFGRPVALLVVAVLHFVSEDEDPHGAVARYLDASPSGSYLVLSHGTRDKQADRPVRALSDAFKKAQEGFHPRSREQVERFFEGLEIVPPYHDAEPKLCFLGEWGAEDCDAADSDGSRWGYAGVARKP